MSIANRESVEYTTFSPKILSLKTSNMKISGLKESLLTNTFQKRTPAGARPVEGQHSSSYFHELQNSDSKFLKQPLNLHSLKGHGLGVGIQASYLRKSQQ